MTKAVVQEGQITRLKNRQWWIKAARAEERERIAKRADNWSFLCREDEDDSGRMTFESFAVEIRALGDEE